jgi:hypothetical protein
VTGSPLPPAVSERAALSSGERDRLAAPEGDVSLVPLDAVPALSVVERGLGRRFVGCDVDAEAVAVTHARLGADADGEAA